jgi:hypothetical protein
MLAEKLIFDRKKYRTPFYHKDLELILNEVRRLIENKKGQSQKNLDLSSEVEASRIKSNNFMKGMKEIERFIEPMH